MTRELTLNAKWTCLKRNDVKVGVEFVPMRKVMFLGSDDLTQGIRE